MQAIQFGTSAAAELLGLEEKIGTLEVGKYADLIALGSSPLEDIKNLEEVTFLLLEGVELRPSSGSR